MKKILLLALAAVVLVLLITFVLRYFRNAAPSTAPVLNPVMFPVASSTSGSQSVQVDDGSLRVRDFLADPDAKEDPVNHGYYYLGYQTFGSTTTENPPYLIEYVAETKYFNVSLLQEPLGDTRKAAESSLLKRLGVTQEQMCGLNYTIGTPTSVNSLYASMNLGFSFCPGSVKLP